MPHDAQPPATDHDRRLTSVGVDAEAPWLDPAAPVSLGHLVRAAEVCRTEPAEVRSRLAELGYQVPPAVLTAMLTRDDVRLLRRSDTPGHWLGPEDAAYLRGHVLWVAETLKKSPAEIAVRLAELGQPAPAPESLPETVEYGDLDVTRSKDRLIPDDVPVPLSHLLANAPFGSKGEDLGQRLSEVVAVRDRLLAFGYLVDPAVMELTAEDLVLLTEDQDGRRPALDPARPVPLAHLLRAAHALDRSPQDLADRLRLFGHHRLPAGPLPAAVTRETAEALVRGDGERLADEDPEWFPHLVEVAARTGQAPAELADHLRALGFAVPHEYLPAEVREGDTGLLWRGRVAGKPFDLARTRPVPVGHVLSRAHERGVSAASVAARLRELGYTHVPAVPDRCLTEEDVRLIRDDVEYGLRVPADTVRLGRLVRAAADEGIGLREAAERYRALGYTDVDLPPGPLPERVDERDARLIESDEAWPSSDHAFRVPYVVRRADALGIAPAAVARRLGELGFREVPGGLPETVHRGDLAMISEDARPGGEPLPPTGVAAGHVRHAADVLGIGVHEVADRLLALGWEPDVRPEPGDEVIVSRDADGRAPWQGWGAGLGHVLLAARALGRSPEEINERSTELGRERQPLPDAEGFEDEDVVLLGEHLDGRGPWLPWGASPSLEHVLRAARVTGRTPEEVGDRLRRLGHRVKVPAGIEVDDIEVLRALPSRYDGHVRDTGEVLGVASRTGRSPAEVAARLSVLGIAHPDLDFPARRPAPSPPRTRRASTAGDA
ncbi:wHTH domain-containing protein [Streptomyces griseoaurantiacus]|uniref:wHTH domain-containing protein n=1 Tax=Streptomyces griseoaurantiacus TaxID=68213 RepID=UPI002ED5DF4F|nr:hypothetical protein OHA67_14430 [Streptomyces jietaisiensis]